MTATANQKKRVQEECSQIAGELVSIQQVSNGLYTFGSEIATLRLFRTFYEAKNRPEQGYSQNLGTYFFSIKLP